MKLDESTITRLTALADTEADYMAADPDHDHSRPAQALYVAKSSEGAVEKPPTEGASSPPRSHLSALLGSRTRSTGRQGQAPCRRCSGCRLGGPQGIEPLQLNRELYRVPISAIAGPAN
jgi:hypothetical protein